MGSAQSTLNPPLPFDAPLVLVLDPDQEAGQALRQLARIGFDHVEGVLRGLDGWTRAGFPVPTHPAETVRALASAHQVLDVRSPAEWDAGHLRGSVHRYLPELVDAPPELDAADPVHVGCATGRRAAIAAGLLERYGCRPVVVTGGGIPDAVQLGRTA